MQVSEDVRRSILVLTEADGGNSGGFVAFCRVSDPCAGARCGIGEYVRIAVDNARFLWTTAAQRLHALASRTPAALSSSHADANPSAREPGGSPANDRGTLGASPRATQAASRKNK
jgi:hypothetical protein